MVRVAGSSGRRSVSWFETRAAAGPVEVPLPVGRRATFTLTPSLLIDILRWRALHQPQRQAYVFLKDGRAEDASLTYAELDHWARGIAVRLRRHCAPGDRALLLYPPGLDYIAGFFGCLYAGVIAVPAYPPNPIRPERTGRRLLSIARDARPAVVLGTDSALSGMRKVWASESVAVTMTEVSTDGWPEAMAIESMAERWQGPEANPDDAAFLQYTSGSTAEPRGVIVTHANLLHNLAVIQDRFGHTAESQGVIWLPPYHDMGLIGGVLQPLYAGFPVALMSPFSFLQRPIRWLQAISTYQATTSGGPDFAYDLAVRRTTPEQRSRLDLKSWQVAFTGAEPIRAETIGAFAEAFAPAGFRSNAFHPCYGLAEGTLMATGGEKLRRSVVVDVSRAALARHDVRPPVDGGDIQTLVGCGRPIDGHEVRVVDPESCAEQRDRIGEIWIAGPSVALGYWSRPEETRQVFAATLSDGVEPFLRTGDLGFLYDGELFVTGRLKDLIILDGRNLYPQDVEFAVAECHSAIRPHGVAAFAVAREGADRLVVAVEFDRGARRARRAQAVAPAEAGQPDVAGEIVKAVRRAVSEQCGASVSDVWLLGPGELPKTSSGKVQRRRCRSNYLSRDAANGSAS